MIGKAISHTSHSFFVSPDRKLMSAAVNGGQAFSVGSIRTLFDTTMRQAGFAGAGAVNYDVSRDGQRFLIVSTTDNSSVTPITLLVNWTGLLKKP